MCRKTWNEFIFKLNNIKEEEEIKIKTNDTLKYKQDKVKETLLNRKEMEESSKVTLPEDVLAALAQFKKK